MATLTLENLPDDLMAQIRQLATQNNQPLDEQVISLLRQALQKKQPLKFLIFPETEPTWEERRKAVPKLQAEIDQRLEKRRAAHLEWPDSTALLREDRDR